MPPGQGESTVAICEQGYLCEVCGRDVEDITDSDLYLRYVLGEIDPERLHLSPERHLTCNPTLAQFIVAEGFVPIVVEGPFAKSALDPEFVAEEEARVTRGYLRLRELQTIEVPITEYPLPEVRARWSDHPDSSGVVAEAGQSRPGAEGGWTE
jgi:hypothetical protein